MRLMTLARTASNLDEIKEFTDGHIGRPNTKLSENPRSGNGRLISGGDEINDISPSLVKDGELQTSYTTYTTLFYEGTSTVSKHTEVYSNVRGPNGEIESDSVKDFSAISSSPVSSAKAAISPSASFPVRRLEVSSVKPA